MTTQDTPTEAQQACINAARTLRKTLHSLASAAASEQLSMRIKNRKITKQDDARMSRLFDSLAYQLEAPGLEALRVLAEAAGVLLDVSAKPSETEGE